MQSSIAIVGLACLVSVGCRGTGSPRPKADGSADRPAADGSADRPAAQDAVGEASPADSDTDTPVARPCDDGTGATDCCPSGAVAGGTCDGAISTCYSRCAFSDGSATQGTRSEFSCIQGLWLAGHGLFPCASSQQGERDSGAVGNDGPAAASYQVTEVTLRGPAAVVAAVATTSLDHIQTSSLTDGTVHALFRSVAGSDWSSTFGFALFSGSSALSLRPWLCPRVPNAVSAARGGALATERRLLDVDADGHFWTNGELGDQVLSICQYSGINGSGGDEATFQDGPDLCTDTSRAGTAIQILDGQQNLVSQPVVCAAGFGLSRTPGYAGQIRLQLEKDADDQDGIAFTVAINHCLLSGAAIPTVITASDMLGSSCPEESVWFQVGAGDGVNKPRSYPVSAGTWNVQAASPDRAASHASQIDLTFSSSDGTVTYLVRGVVALPQLLF